MTGNEFERKIKRIGRKRGIPCLVRSRSWQGQSWPTVFRRSLHNLEGSAKGNRPWLAQGDARAARAIEGRFGGLRMAFGYRFTLERQDNGWWLVRFPGVPEALTEGERQDEARANAVDCVIAALEGYMKAGKPLPRQGGTQARRNRAVLP